jgi:hypothetical protein
MPGGDRGQPKFSHFRVAHREEIDPMQMKQAFGMLTLSGALALFGGAALAQSEAPAAGLEDAVTAADEAAEAEAKAAEADAEARVEKAEEKAEQAAEQQAEEVSGQ